MAISTRELLLLLRAKNDTERALGGLSRNLRSTGAQADAASARSQAAALRAAATQARLSGATRAQVQALRDASRGWDDHARSIDRNRARLQAHRDMLRMSGEAMTAVGVGLAAAGTAGLFAAKSWIDTAVQYERQVRLTRTQVDKMKYSFDQLHAVGIRVARDLPIRFEEVQPALFDIFSSMEVGLEDAERLLRAFSKGAVAGQVEIQAVSRATIGLLNAFKLPASDVNRILDLQFELVQEGIGTYEEWNQRIGLVTPSAVRAGQSIEVMIAALAASTRMGISAARSGTAVARAFDAMSHPKVVGRLERLGIKVRDVHGRMLPLNEVLGDFREQLMKLPEKDRLEAMLDVFSGAGSTIEARRFLQNVLLGAGGLELFNNVLKETENSAGNTERAYKELADGTASMTERVRNSWQILKESLGKALLPAFNSLLEMIRSVIDWFNKLPQSTQGAIGKFFALGSIVAIVTGGLFVLIGTLAIFGTAIAGIGAPILIAIAAVGAIVVALGLGVMAFRKAYKESEAFRTLIGNMGKKLGEVRDIVTDTFEEIQAAWSRYAAPALRELRDVIETEVLPALDEFQTQVWDELKPKLEEAGRLVKDVLTVAFVIFAFAINGLVIPAIKDLTKWYKENKEELEPLIAISGQAAKTFLLLAAILVGSVAVGFFMAAGAMRVAMAVFLAVTGVVLALIGWFKQLWERILGIGDASKRMASAVKNSIAGAIAAFGSLRAIVLGLFHGAGLWLYRAGVNVVGGFISGVRSMIGALRTVFGGITSMIPNIKGPKDRDLNLLRPAGRWIMTGLVQGIIAEVPNLQRTLDNVTGLFNTQRAGLAATSAIGRVGVGSAQTTVFNSGGNKTFNQTFNITTTDPDPRQLAADIGWEVANVVG